MTTIVVSAGRIVGAGGAVCAVPAGSVSPQSNAPWFGTNASGGDQSYGSNQAGFGGATGYTTAASGTQAYAAVQALGRNDVVFALGGSFESWGTSGTGRNKNDLVNAIKGRGTFANVINSARGCYVFPYAIYESQQNLTTGAAYQEFVTLVINNNWWLYESTGGTGTKEPSAASGTGWFNVNYAYAWGTAAGTVPLGFTICGNAYGTQSNGQGPARTAAQYFVTMLLSTDRTTDTRFSGLAVNGAAPAADGLNVDNLFCYPNAGGNLSTSASWDGQNLQTNATVAAYPSGASSLMAQGQTQFFATMQNFLGTVNPGQTYINCGNFGSYANVTDNGNTHTATANAMDGVLGAAWLEDVAGVSGFGWQVRLTATQILANIDYGIGYLQAPKILGVGVRMPSTDGSTTSSFLTGGTVQTVTAGSALEYQELRCMAACVHMRNAYVLPTQSGYDYSLVRWYDEAGDDSLTQVNVKRGWLGIPTGIPVTLSNGIQVRPFLNGCVAFNAWGNGAQTLTAGQVLTATGRNTQLIAGTQQPTINTGLGFVSRAMADADGLFLLYA